MKTILFCFLFFLTLTAPARAQGFIFVNADAEPLPELEFTLATLIDITAEYEIIQETNPTFCRSYHGMTDYVTKTISICAFQDITFRRKTLIHESLHILYWSRGINTGGPYDAQIEAKAEAIFQRLYGVQLPTSVTTTPQ